MKDIERYQSLEDPCADQALWDTFVNPHPRYPTMMESFRELTKENGNLKIPLFQDVNTSKVKIDGKYNQKDITINTRHIGFGCCSLQTTYECQNLEHAMYLHDSLISFTGIIGALSAS